MAILYRALTVAALAALALSGCAEYDAGFSAANSYVQTEVSAQKTNIQGANDTAAQAWADVSCAIPYGELVRNGSGNPNLPRAVIELCGQPSGVTITYSAASAVTTTTTPAATATAK